MQLKAAYGIAESIVVDGDMGRMGLRMFARLRGWEGLRAEGLACRDPSCSLDALFAKGMEYTN